MNQDQVKPGPMYINPSKKYGLIIPQKQNSQLNKPQTIQKPVAKPCIFDQDEDEDNLDDSESFKKKPTTHQVNTSSSLLKKQTQIEIEKALKQDQTVFEYDEIYDELEKEKQKLDPKQNKKNESKEPKYIVGIMKAAAKRKMDYEKIQERKIHKEREEEGDMWSDKEVFVTTAYRKKMEERQKLEEEERRQEQIENLLDVRKQKDLSGFYYSLLKMRTGELVIEEESEKEKRLEKERLEEAAKLKEKAKSLQQKTFRPKREESEGEEEEEVEDHKEDNQEKPEQVESEQQNETKTESELKEPLAKKTKSEEEEEEKENIKTEPEIKLSKEEERKQRLEKLFKKRTVGEKFDTELKDYFARKSQILSSKNYIEKEQ